MNIKKYFQTVLIFIPCLFIAGCFEYEERLVIKKDGSGFLEVEYWSMEDLQLENESFNFPDKEDDILEKVKKSYTSEKIKLEDFHVKQKNETQNVRFKLSFKNVLDLNDVPQFQKNFIQFTRVDKIYNFHRTVFNKEGKLNMKEEPENVFERFILQIVEDGLSKIKFRFELELPDKIVHSNADWSSGDKRAIWKYRLSDIIFKEKIEMTASTK